MIFYKRSRKEKAMWHRWYAWYPVTVSVTPDGDFKRVWLEWVQRCGMYEYDDYDIEGGYWLYNYRI